MASLSKQGLLHHSQHALSMMQTMQQPVQSQSPFNHNIGNSSGLQNRPSSLGGKLNYHGHKRPQTASNPNKIPQAQGYSHLTRTESPLGGIATNAS